MKLPIRFYKNSVIATIISIWGTTWTLVGFCVAISEDAIAGIVLAVVGICLIFVARVINEKAIFKKWIKGLKKDGIVEKLSTSEEMCIAVYNANPCKKNIKYIRKHNPVVAEKLLFEINKKREK